MQRVDASETSLILGGAAEGGSGLGGGGDGGSGGCGGAGRARRDWARAPGQIVLAPNAPQGWKTMIKDDYCTLPESNRFEAFIVHCKSGNDFPSPQMHCVPGDG